MFYFCRALLTSPISNLRSIVFTIMFAVLLPLAIFRLVVPSSRGAVLIRPTIFTVVRIATYIIRAVQADGNYSTGLFIAEQVRFFVLLIGIETDVVRRSWCLRASSCSHRRLYRSWVTSSSKDGFRQVNQSQSSCESTVSPSCWSLLPSLWVSTFVLSFSTVSNRFLMVVSLPCSLDQRLEARTITLVS